MKNFLDLSVFVGQINMFRIIGDVLHLLAMFYLLKQIWKRKSCAGISGKSQILLAVVFTARYTDLLSGRFSTPYNTMFKIIFIAATYLTVYLIFVTYKDTYESGRDSFHSEFLLILAMIVALFHNYGFETYEILWAFSIYLEVVALVPQLWILTKTKKIKKFIHNYLMLLMLYRFFYILNWIYRYINYNQHDMISIVSGSVQTSILVAYLVMIALQGSQIKQKLRKSGNLAGISVINKDTDNLVENSDEMEKNIIKDCVVSI